MPQYTIIESKWDGKNLPWVFAAGKAANAPTAAEVAEGSFYFETDTKKLKNLNPDADTPWGTVYDFGG